jgi:hypothetical protein
MIVTYNCQLLSSKYYYHTGYWFGFNVADCPSKDGAVCKTRLSLILKEVSSASKVIEHSTTEPEIMGSNPATGLAPEEYDGE